jgi:uncharacterized membrane protein
MSRKEKLNKFFFAYINSCLRFNQIQHHLKTEIVKEENIKKATRILLGASLIFAGTSHLSFARKAFRAQVPDWVPLKKDDTVVYSGFVEIALGSALVFTGKKHEKTVGKIAAAFFTAVFPGNISQYVHKRNAFGLNSDKKRFMRLLFQPPLVYWAIKSTD